MRSPISSGLIRRRPAAGSKNGQPHVVVLLEHDLHRHADAHVVGLAADDVGGEPQALLLGQLDDGDHVGRVEVRVPRLPVDREGVHDRAGPTRRLDRERRGRGTAGRSGAGGWIQQPHASQRRKRSSPSAPPGQKCSFSGRTAGSTRNGRRPRRPRRRRCPRGEAASKPCGRGAAPRRRHEPKPGWVSMSVPTTSSQWRRTRPPAWRGARRRAGCAGSPSRPGGSARGSCGRAQQRVDRPR